MGHVSYSQFANWMGCPWRWKLTYIDGHKNESTSIYLIFGTAMHNVLEKYLHIVFDESVKKANKMDYKKELIDELKKATIQQKKGLSEGLEFDDYVTLKEIREFYYDGINILEWFMKYRSEHFNSRNEELVGTEIPLKVELKSKKDLKFVAYLDVVIKNKFTGKYRIIDFKTSTKGWKDYAKKDEAKTAQLILYKAFYANVFKVNPRDIDVEFIILKRKLYENLPYPQKRIQKFSPASGMPTLKKNMERFNEFIETSFNTDGTYKDEKNFPKIPTDWNCRYCDFANNPDLCDRKLGS